MLLVRLFGLTLSAALVLTSVLIAVMGGKFQDVEKAAYTKGKKPWWFLLAALTMASFYTVALISFLTSPDKTWAGWGLMVVIPLGAVIKGSLVIFNKKGQEKVTSIEGDSAWRKIAAARLALLPIFLVLIYFI